MAGSFVLTASPAGTVLAVACVVAGGPWFVDGLRAWRARMALRTLNAPASRTPRQGPMLARGRVVLESPLFAPLSGRPCAGYELDVRDGKGTYVGRVRDVRDFQVELEPGVVQVSREADWRLGVSDERTYGSASELSENLQALFQRQPELRWLLSRAGALTLCERALFASAEAHVLGCGLHGEDALAAPVVLQRTGTDDVDVELEAPESAGIWSIGRGEALDRCVVSDRALEPRRLAPPVWRAAGALLGPALALVGLLQLAQSVGNGVGGGL